MICSLNQWSLMEPTFKHCQNTCQIGKIYLTIRFIVQFLYLYLYLYLHFYTYTCKSLLPVGCFLSIELIVDSKMYISEIPYYTCVSFQLPYEDSFNWWCEVISSEAWSPWWMPPLLSAAHSLNLQLQAKASSSLNILRCSYEEIENDTLWVSMGLVWTRRCLILVKKNICI